MTEKIEQASAGVAPELNAELGLCSSCKYWCRDKDKYGHYSGEAYHLGLGQCLKAKMLFDCVKWDDDAETTVFSESVVDDCKVFVQDGSDYRAWMLTKRGFGCVSWQSKT